MTTALEKAVAIRSQLAGMGYAVTALDPAQTTQSVYFNVFEPGVTFSGRLWHPPIGKTRKETGFAFVRVSDHPKPGFSQQRGASISKNVTVEAAVARIVKQVQKNSTEPKRNAGEGEPPGKANGKQYIYAGPRKEHHGKVCTVLHKGQTISRVRFKDGATMAAANKCLLPASTRRNGVTHDKLKEYGLAIRGSKVVVVDATRAARFVADLRAKASEYEKLPGSNSQVERYRQNARAARRDADKYEKQIAALRGQKNPGKKRNPDTLAAKARRLVERFIGKSTGRESSAQHPGLKCGTVLSNLHARLDYLQLENHRIDWLGSERPHIMSDPGGRQYFLVGGDQGPKAAEGIEPLAAADGMADLGPVLVLGYTAKKHVDHFRLQSYYHHFGEENGKRPHLCYDRRQKQFYLTGGDYRTEAEGIAN